MYPNQDVDECKILCSQNIRCLAFEYGIPGGSFAPRSCQLNSDANRAGCDQAGWGSDLYIKCNIVTCQKLKDNLYFVNKIIS